MSSLNNLTKMLTGEFNNQEQFDSLRTEEKQIFPFSIHKNHVLNNKIINLPKNFDGIYIHEESYYTLNGKERFKSDLFLFTYNESGNVVLKSVVVPNELKNCHFEKIDKLDFNDLTLSKKFIPLEYIEKDNIFTGESKSKFTKKTEFILTQTISEDSLIIKEEMFNGSKMIFGFSKPIIYKRL